VLQYQLTRTQGVLSPVRIDHQLIVQLRLYHNDKITAVIELDGIEYRETDFGQASLCVCLARYGEQDYLVVSQMLRLDYGIFRLPVIYLRVEITYPVSFQRGNDNVLPERAVSACAKQSYA